MPAANDMNAGRVKRICISGNRANIKIMLKVFNRNMKIIALNYGGGPVGIDTLAAALSEPRDALEDIVEPYLLQLGLLQRTPRGRCLTPQAFKHLGLKAPAATVAPVAAARRW